MIISLCLVAGVAFTIVAKCAFNGVCRDIERRGGWLL